MSAPGSASMADVAALAGVSLKTVSRVVNGEPNVRPATRARVEAVIESLGYRPSLTARALASHRSYRLDILCYTPRSDYFAELQLAATSVCQAEGYHLVVSMIEDFYDLSAQSLEAKLENLLDRPRPDGAVLPPPFADDLRVLKKLRDLGIPFVRISPFRHDIPSPYVCVDETKAAFELTRYLLEAGHERIAFIRGNPAHGATERRAAGYKAALEDAGLPYYPELVLDGDFHFLSGLEAGTALCQRRDRPTAIFASNDEMAAGVTVAAHRAGLDLPSELSVVGFDDTAVAQLTWPALTTVHQPLFRLGEAATKMAIEFARGAWGRDEMAVTELDYRIVFRESVAPPKKPRAPRR